MAFIGIVLVVAFFQTITEASLVQKLTSPPHIIYTNSRVNYTFVEDQPTLTGLDSISQVCNNGVWVSYTGQYYTGGPGGGVIELLPFVRPSCSTPRDSQAGSARFVGLRGEPSAPSVTFFSETTLRGYSFAVAAGSGIANATTTLKSVVSIDSNQVEFFSEPNYLGESYCYEADPASSCLDEVCWTWFFDIDQLPWDITYAKSVTAGCRANAKVYRYKVSRRANAITLHK